MSKSEATIWARKRIEKWRAERKKTRYGIMSPLYGWGFEDGVHEIWKLFGGKHAEVSESGRRKGKAKD